MIISINADRYINFFWFTFLRLDCTKVVLQGSMQSFISIPNARRYNFVISWGEILFGISIEASLKLYAKNGLYLSPATFSNKKFHINNTINITYFYTISVDTHLFVPWQNLCHMNSKDQHHLCSPFQMMTKIFLDVDCEGKKHWSYII